LQSWKYPGRPIFSELRGIPNVLWWFELKLFTIEHWTLFISEIINVKIVRSKHTEKNYFNHFLPISYFLLLFLPNYYYYSLYVYLSHYYFKNLVSSLFLTCQVSFIHCWILIHFYHQFCDLNVFLSSISS